MKKGHITWETWLILTLALILPTLITLFGTIYFEVIDDERTHNVQVKN